MYEISMCVLSCGATVLRARALIVVSPSQRADVVKEAAPAELETIAKELLENLFPVLQALVAGAAAAGASAAAPHDELLRLLVRCLHHTVGSYMPRSLEKRAAAWAQELLKLLAVPRVAEPAKGHLLPRAKAAKVSMIKLTHNNCTAVRGSGSLAPAAVFASLAMEIWPLMAPISVRDSATTLTVT